MKVHAEEGESRTDDAPPGESEEPSDDRIGSGVPVGEDRDRRCGYEDRNRAGPEVQRLVDDMNEESARNASTAGMADDRGSSRCAMEFTRRYSRVTAKASGGVRPSVVTFEPDRLEERFWARHSNPKSGWSRVPTGPVIAYAVYRREWRLLCAALLWAVINPFLFPPPATGDAWMTRAVLAERWWIREKGNRTLGVRSPNVYNAGSAVAAAYTLYAAWRRRPVGATLGTVLTVGLKLQWLRLLVRRYDCRET